MVARRTKLAGLAPVPFAIVVALATIAFALMTIGIKDSQVPVQASEFGEHESCDFQGSPSQSPPLWGWHFVLPGGSATFVSLTAEFEDAGTVTLPGPGGSFVQDGKGAVVYTSTDDTLTDATAEIEGTTPQGYFVLSNTCLPTPTTSPTTSPSVSATSSQTGSPSGTPSESPSATVSATVTTTSPTTSASETPSETPSAEVSGTVFTRPPSDSPSESVSPTVLGVRQTRVPAALPTTGSAVGMLLGIGLLLVAAGVALVCRTPRGKYAR